MVKSGNPLDLKDNVSHVRYGVEEVAYQVSTVQLPDGMFESAYRRFDVEDIMEFLRTQQAHISLWVMVRQTSLGNVLEAKTGVSVNLPWRAVRQYQDESSAREGHEEIIGFLQGGQERQVLRM